MIFFIVPDSDDDLDGLDGLDMDSGESDEQKAQLDQGEASRAAQKVDLDLDDAPFLEDEDEDEDEDDFEEEEEELEEPKEKKPPPAWLTSKPFLIGAPVGLLLIIGAIWFFTRPEPVEEPPAPPPAEEFIEEEELVEEPVEGEPVKAPPPPTKPDETLIRLAPFWVEQQTTDGNVRFLIARFSLTTTDDRLAVEFNRKLLIIRDAVYYYLKNKDLEFISDKGNSEKLKADLLTVINQYMGSGEFKTLLIEEYLVK